MVIDGDLLMESDALVSKAEEALQESQNAVKDGQGRQIARLLRIRRNGNKTKGSKLVEGLW